MKSKINFEYNRNFTLILYPDDLTHMYALQLIEDKYKYAMILHDRDKTESGEIKKEHYHVVIHFESARYRKAVAKELGIEENYITGCVLKAQLRYLIHIDDKDKYQYAPEEVSGTLKNIFLNYIEVNKKNMNLEIMEIIETIENKKIHNIKELTIWACENNCIDIIMKNSYLFINILKCKIR